MLSGVCVIDRDRTRTAAAQTVVEFRALDSATIDAYVATGRVARPGRRVRHPGRRRPAGHRIEGDYLSVVGLPVGTLLDLLPELVAGLIRV